MDTLIKQSMKSFDPTAMKRFSGLTDDLVNTLTITFHQELHSSNSQLSEAIGNQDWKTARQVIHTMRPGFLMFGQEEAATLMGEMLETGIGFEYPGSIDKLNRYLGLSTTLENQIQQYLVSQPGE